MKTPCCGKRSSLTGTGSPVEQRLKELLRGALYDSILLIKLSDQRIVSVGMLGSLTLPPRLLTLVILHPLTGMQNENFHIRRSTNAFGGGIVFDNQPIRFVLS